MYLKSYKELTVWQKSIDLVKEVYSITKIFPKDELYGLTSQIRRSAVSIPSNIAEGHSRKGTLEFIQFLKIADASSSELETQLIIAKEIYPRINYQKVFSLLDKIQRMLSVLIRKLKLNAHPSPLNARGGFTLVEMAITATIMIIASGMLIVFSQSSGNRLTLATEQAKIGGILNRTKSLALQRYRTEGGSACGFAFRWNDPLGSYAIAPVLRAEETEECTDIQPDIETFELHRSIMFQGSPDAIIFESPYLTTKNPQVIQIALRENSEEVAGVEITAGGAIVLK